MSEGAESLPTLPFSEWLRAIGEASVDAGRSGAGMAVACGECRGCCTSAYFIPVGPEESDTLAAIPKRLLFAAPGMPKGHFLLGYAENGHCAMFQNNACSIYAQRPRACRAYDCRLFAATGLSEEEKPVIARQAERWRFAFPSEEDRRLFAAVRAAARFLRGHASEFPAGFLPANATQQAGLALRVYDLFLQGGKGTAEIIDEMVKRAGGRSKSVASKKPAGRAASKVTGEAASRPADGTPRRRTRPRPEKPG
jgi:Fe-S-cluster containining protein